MQRGISLDTGSALPLQSDLSQNGVSRSIGADRGDIAQLGERCVRIAEVGGSNPPISTNYIFCLSSAEDGLGHLRHEHHRSYRYPEIYAAAARAHPIDRLERPA